MKMMIFGLMFLVFGLMLFGCISSSPKSEINQTTTTPSQQNMAGVQDVYLKALSSGAYDKAEFTVKKGIPVRLHFSAESNVGCGRQFMIKSMNVNLVSNNGEEKIAEFTPDQAGTYEYSCSMRMFRGKMIVV